MVLPTFLRKRFNQIKLGFFLHSPFPSSEIYRILPVRNGIEILKQFDGKKIILGIDDMDIFKGISLKLLAMEQLLQQYPELQGKLVLVQILNPARGSGKDVHEAKKETYSTAKRINEAYGSPNYEPVILIDHPVPSYEKSAYFAVAECSRFLKLQVFEDEDFNVPKELRQILPSPLSSVSLVSSQ